MYNAEDQMLLTKWNSLSVAYYFERIGDSASSQVKNESSFSRTKNPRRNSMDFDFKIRGLRSSSAGSDFVTARSSVSEYHTARPSTTGNHITIDRPLLLFHTLLREQELIVPPGQQVYRSDEGQHVEYTNLRIYNLSSSVRFSAVLIPLWTKSGANGFGLPERR